MSQTSSNGHFKRIDHIGVVVADLPAAVRYVSEVLGMQFQREVALPEKGVTAVFLKCGEIELELLEVRDEQERRERLGDGATARVEHVAIEVDDVGAAVAALATHGGATTTPEPLEVQGNKSFWTRPDSTGGVMYQLIEKAR